MILATYLEQVAAVHIIMLCTLCWALIALIFGVCMSSVLLTISNHKYTCLFTVLHYVVIIIGLATYFEVSSGLPW